MTKPYRTHLFERLQTQEDRVGYLRAAFEEGEVTFALAVQDVCNSVNFATPTPTEPSVEQCEWSWNARKEFWASGCGDALELDGGEHYFDYDKHFKHCPFCAKQIKLLASREHFQKEKR